MRIGLKFTAASEAAEGWINTVGLVAGFGQGGSVGPAYELLMPTKGVRYNLLDSYSQYAAILEQARDMLATVSDSAVRWEHGRGLSGLVSVPSAVFPHVWSSAHEAAAGITELALARLVMPLEGIDDSTEWRLLAERLLTRCSKSLAIPLHEVASLQERIRRERAKLKLRTDVPLGEAEIGLLPSQTMPRQGLDERAVAAFLMHRDWTKKQLVPHLSSSIA